MEQRELYPRTGVGNGRYYVATLGGLLTQACVETYSSREKPGQCDGVVTLTISQPLPYADLRLTSVETFPESERVAWALKRIRGFTDHGWKRSGQSWDEILTETPDT